MPPVADTVARRELPRQMTLPLAGMIGTPLRLVDLFAGAGGLAYGFEEARLPCGCPAFELIAAVEKDPDACATLRSNLTRRYGEGQGRVLEEDLTSPDTHRKIAELAGPDGVSIVIGGPPCQSYSQIGTRTGKWVGDKRFESDDRDLLFQHYVALVRTLQPAFIVLENVDGIRSKKNKQGRRYLDIIVEALEDAGYSFTIAGSRQKYLKLNAADYGVPQIRNRVFLVGNRLGLPFQPPSPSHYDPDQPEDRRPPSARWPWVTLRDAIGDLPWVRAHCTRTHLSAGEWAARQEDNRKRNNGSDEVPYHTGLFNCHYRSRREVGQRFLDFVRPKDADAPLRYHRARDQQASDIELFERMPEGTTSKEIFEGDDPALRALAPLIRYTMTSFKDKYRKQAWDAPSTTVFAHLERDGNRFIHPDSWQARTFTVREAARVQSFPDDYEFEGGLKSRYRQIGNAVPPLLALAIATAIQVTLMSAGSVVHRCGRF